MTKNFKHQINSQQVLSELTGLSKKEQLNYLLSLHLDLARDSLERATHPLAIEILTETYKFREKAAEAGKKGMESRYAKDKQPEQTQVKIPVDQQDGMLD